VHKQFCDRCNSDVTNRPSDVLHVIENADAHGNGTVTADIELCKRCTRAFEAWIGIKATRKRSARKDRP